MLNWHSHNHSSGTIELRAFNTAAYGANLEIVQKCQTISNGNNMNVPVTKYSIVIDQREDLIKERAIRLDLLLPCGG